MYELNDTCVKNKDGGICVLADAVMLFLLISHGCRVSIIIELPLTNTRSEISSIYPNNRHRSMAPFPTCILNASCRVFLSGFSDNLAILQTGIDPGSSLIRHCNKQRNSALMNQFHYGDSRVS